MLNGLEKLFEKCFVWNEFSEADRETCRLESSLAKKIGVRSSYVEVSEFENSEGAFKLLFENSDTYFEDVEAAVEHGDYNCVASVCGEYYLVRADEGLSGILDFRSFEELKTEMRNSL